MRRLNRTNTGMTSNLPVRVVQYGEGNFLRAFVDYIINKLNKETDFNAGVAVVQPLAKGLVDILNEQDGLYTLFMEGVRKGEEIQKHEVVSCIQKALNPYDDYDAYLNLAKEEELEFMISNTTEAGITFDENDTLEGYPHKSFPAKMTALLYQRYQFFDGAENKGLTIIPCELINHNANTLKKIILQYSELWNLERAFFEWLEKHNSFHNTLVDRIVPGYPRNDFENYQGQLEFEDKLIVSAEVFLLWVIEGDEKLKAKIPFDKIDENIKVVEDLQPYRTRKVRILNGAHTTMVPFSIMFGNETVKETIDHSFTGEFVKKAVFGEINFSLDLAEDELKSFAEEVFDRFRNPFIKHQLSSIALNSISKFKVRVLPSLISFQEKNKRIPLRLTYAFACLLRFYKGNWEGRELPVNDDPEIVSEFKKTWQDNNYSEIAQKLLSNTGFWERDLTNIPDLKKTTAIALELLEENGVEEGFRKFEKKFQ